MVGNKGVHPLYEFLAGHLHAPIQVSPLGLGLE